ncbi:hypothetical protein G6F47_011433 [Rhizopus delemar]|uniref:Uncharacterized protein n=1 Tax=Rhizopus oryzae TaxID=64495 RepID=A0A9P7C4R0_RHIOR|nr:hypothetical protein G6F54_005974 [Rhizopus delemar]KAG1536319.1 hypothetical protein G6F51_011037 [Rhizopus arrhizus]KAG1543298.1 hypothetical protein G6F49_011386 [Rhizopus delemar]KAG1585657.1 hypothetical protein G6F47_011433 [Rhizopus delemar]KAG1623642.1 hypothetical protein G6F45_010781 [Rhizopus arrhizus]
MNAHPQDNLHQPRQRTSHLHLISPHSLQFPYHDMAPIRFAILKRNQCINNNKDAISVNNLPQVPIGQLRSRQRKLNIDNNRILDIHYPDRNGMVLLVYNGYSDERRPQLKRSKFILKDNSDSCDPKTLCDSKYANATDEERTGLVFMLIAIE